MGAKGLGWLLEDGYVLQLSAYRLGTARKTARSLLCPKEHSQEALADRLLSAKWLHQALLAQALLATTMVNEEVSHRTSHFYLDLTHTASASVFAKGIATNRNFFGSQVLVRVTHIGSENCKKGEPWERVGGSSSIPKELKVL